MQWSDDEELNFNQGSMQEQPRQEYFESTIFFCFCGSDFRSQQLLITHCALAHKIIITYKNIQFHCLMQEKDEEAEPTHIYSVRGQQNCPQTRGILFEGDDFQHPKYLSEAQLREVGRIPTHMIQFQGCKLHFYQNVLRQNMTTTFCILRVFQQYLQDQYQQVQYQNQYKGLYVYVDGDWVTLQLQKFYSHRFPRLGLQDITTLALFFKHLYKYKCTRIIVQLDKCFLKRRKITLTPDHPYYDQFSDYLQYSQEQQMTYYDKEIPFLVKTELQVNPQEQQMQCEKMLHQLKIDDDHMMEEEHMMQEEQEEEISFEVPIGGQLPYSSHQRAKKNLQLMEKKQQQEAGDEPQPNYPSQIVLQEMKDDKPFGYYWQ